MSNAAGGYLSTSSAGNSDPTVTAVDEEASPPPTEDKSSNTKTVFRVALVLSLAVAATVCSTLSYRLLRKSEREVGIQTYQSIADSALNNAKSATHRKLQGSVVMATVVGQMVPDTEDWPLISIPGYIPMASAVAESSGSNTQALMVFLSSEEAVEYQDHIKGAYAEQGRPETAGFSDFGFGIWAQDTKSVPTYADGRVHDINGTNSWGGQHDDLIASLTFHNSPGASSLLYNVYSEADRGIYVDDMLACVKATVDKSNITASPPKIQCSVITDMLELKVRPGPAGLLFNPVFPANNPTTIVGFATTSIHWQNVLEFVVPDYVSGLTCVVSTATSNYTYVIQNGKPELVGDGDLHDPAYTNMGQSKVLNDDIPTDTTSSAVYTLTVYPTDAIFEPFQSNGPLAVSFGFAAAILLCALLFVLYDFLVRLQESRHKKLVRHLVQENKRIDNRNLWAIKTEELSFDDPPEVLGRGSFGVVLLGQYRGTSVACKRVLPSLDENTTETKERRSTMLSNLFTKSASKLVDEDIESALAMEDGMKSGGRSSAFQTLSSTASQNLTHEQLKQEFKDEMRHLSRLRHPNITTVMGAIIDDDEEPMLVMEFMDYGSLFDLLHNETMAIDGDIILPILRDISQGMRFLHTANPKVIHGDLKAQNILVDKRFRAKVADFGLSQKKKIGGTGTPFWMAPELLRGESSNTTASDIYSFGVILYEVYSRKVPYEGESTEEVLRGVTDKSICKRVQAPKSMPPAIKLLMEDCLQEDPEMRPSFEEVDLRLKRIDAETASPSGYSRKKNNVSLFDMFPRHIAEALRDGRDVEPEHKELITLFFSDIVGFTDLSAKLDPRKVANMLDRLYTKFDSLTKTYDCYKLETIGDAFIAATSLVKDQPDDHCKLIAQFSIAALEAANSTLVDEDDPSMGCINLRVGFHSGPIVADVVGNRNPKYTLFGDTINVASRMESNSAKNRINCSDRAAALLREQWPEVQLLDRGEIEIKGKGRMRCFFVDSRCSAT